MLYTQAHFRKTTIFAICFLFSFALTGCVSNKPLKKELTAIWKQDQSIRAEWGKAWKEYGQDHPLTDSLANVMHAQDSLHTARVTSIIDQFGWLGKKEVGTLASNTLFVVIQHSDLKTQQKYLPVMRKAVAEGKASGSWLALLEDRVAMREGRKQIYGSQIHYNHEKNVYYVAPLLDPDNVDKRRKEVGLNSFSRYLKAWNITWNSEEYKSSLPDLEIMERQISK